MNRIARLTMAAALVAAGACDDDDRPDVEGTFRFGFAETRDTCDQELDVFSSTITIRRQGDGVVLDFGGGTEIPGTIDEEGIIQAEGEFTTNVPVDDQLVPVTGTLRMQIGILRQSIVANGRITYAGTFPGVEGTCEQQFEAEGERLGVAPALPTGP